MSCSLHYSGKPLLPRQQGVALAIVIWFIAGMSLLVAGIVSRASVDTRMTQLHVARAKVSAAGDGAVQLLLAQMTTSKQSAERTQEIQRRQIRIGDIDVAVSLVPTAGLIDLNAAPPEILSALFLTAGEVDQAGAQVLADNVVDWRSARSSQGAGKRVSSRFREIEDMLQVEGIGRTLLDDLRDYVVAGNAARGGMDWLRAPPGVLAVLQRSDERRYAAVLRRKERVATAAGNARGAGSASLSGAYRADAVVRYGGRTWVRRHWVLLQSSGRSLLPWRILRTEAPRVSGRMNNDQ